MLPLDFSAGLRVPGLFKIGLLAKTVVKKKFINSCFSTWFFSSETSPQIQFYVDFDFSNLTFSVYFKSLYSPSNISPYFNLFHFFFFLCSSFISNSLFICAGSLPPLFDILIIGTHHYFLKGVIPENKMYFLDFSSLQGMYIQSLPKETSEVLTFFTVLGLTEIELILL